MKKIVYFIIITAVLFGTYKLLSKPTTSLVGNASSNNADLIIFIQQGCGHCENVEKFIQDNNVMSKIKVNYIDIRQNLQNQQLLEDTVKKCPEINASQGIGTPLGYLPKENKCLYGDTPIIDYLKMLQ